MSEIEVLRAIDPGLAKAKRKNLKHLSLSPLFLSNLPPDTSPADLYISLTGQTSSVIINPDTHIVSDSEPREDYLIICSTRILALSSFPVPR